MGRAWLTEACFCRVTDSIGDFGLCWISSSAVVGPSSRYVAIAARSSGERQQLVSHHELLIGATTADPAVEQAIRPPAHLAIARNLADARDVEDSRDLANFPCWAHRQA